MSPNIKFCFHGNCFWVLRAIPWRTSLESYIPCRAALGVCGSLLLGSDLDQKERLVLTKRRGAEASPGLPVLCQQKQRRDWLITSIALETRRKCTTLRSLGNQKFQRGHVCYKKGKEISGRCSGRPPYFEKAIFALTWIMYSLRKTIYWRPELRLLFWQISKHKIGKKYSQSLT